MNGVEPKLKRHCWNDMKLAAAKYPDELEVGPALPVNR